MVANTRDNSSGSSKYKPRQERFSVQRALELLGLIDGNNSDLEDLSDNDDPILDANYQPPPTGAKQQRRLQTHQIEADRSYDDSEEPTPGPITQGQPNKADGIVLDFDLYQGKGALLEQVEEEEVGLGLGGLVLARLCQTLHRGTKVYCDRFFTSIRCVEQMMKKEMYITGTIMKNRLAGAKEKLPSDKTMKNTGREPEDTCQRWDKKLKQYVTVSRPSIVREYNLKMGGVDLIDRMISYYRMSARTKKWTMRMLMHFTDLALANSWLLYRKDLAICALPNKSIMQFLEFRTEMATTLLAQHHGQGSDADLSEQSEEEDNSNQGKTRPVTAVPHVSVRRRANAHLPEMISLKNAARCRVAGCTGRTRVRCVTCKVFLCLKGDRNCYTAFHT
ncbi:hypothetical protein KUCAC02_008441 [Chaenocephalus aceratus]|uniref:Uncharacterized protein n=1 Tax=Chaenocephalus aceratus TaxID=36190 RepID=A0ACB9X8F8_CHAAC|nr:hypothetical protein KUCAC02_008441 [Chaenocephalus aceratus]